MLHRVEVRSPVVDVRWKVGEGFSDEKVEEPPPEEVGGEEEEELQLRLEEAYRSGFEDGRRMGFESAWGRLREVAELLRTEAGALSSAKDDLLRGAEEGVLTIAAEVARRLVGVCVERFPEEVVGVVRRCVRMVSGGTRAVVRVNPEDLRILEEHREEISLDCEVELRADPGVPKGGCVVDTEHGAGSGRLRSMLEEVERAMRENLELRYVREG